MSILWSPFGNAPFILANLQAASGYKLYIYKAASTEKATVYSAINGSAQHPNPITLGSDGWPPGSIYLDSAFNYKFVYAHPLDSDPPTIQITPPVDHVALVAPSAQVLASEWQSGTTPTYISSTQFSVTGNQTATYHVGRRVKAVVSAGTVYATITAVSFSSVTTVTISPDSTTLDAGLSAVSYSFLSASGSSWPSGYNTGLTTNFSGPVTIPVDKAFNLIPVGFLYPYAGVSYPPPGTLLCNGGDHQESVYPVLADALLGNFGVSALPGFFKVPNIANLATNIRYVIRYA